MEMFLYNFFLLLYKISARLISPWNKKAKLWLEGRKDIFSKIEASGIMNQSSIIWMHCSSLGEFEQGRPLIEDIRKKFPSYKILISFFSPSGYEVRKNYEGADYIFYLPTDSAANAKRFIKTIRPKLVLWVKYEYWFYFLEELKREKIPTLLISGIYREEQVFFRWYGGLYRKALHSFTHFFVQTANAKKLLGGIGFSNNVTVSGDTRFDRVIEIASHFEPIETIEKFCGKHPVIVAGSTWEEDEEQLDHYANSHQEIRFILAPHEIGEDRIKEIENLFRNTIRFSVLQQLVAEGKWPIATSTNNQQLSVNVLIIDNIGILARLYKYASIAYVGGGFGDDGVHNVLEAAVYGKPVVHGPVIEKYIEAIELVDAGGAFVVDSALEAEETFNRLFSDNVEYTSACIASSEYVNSRKGATEKILHYIQENRLLTN